MATFAHIINPVSVADSADLHRTQKITFRSITNAKAYGGERCHVKLYSAQYEDARTSIPADFIMTPDLTQTVASVFVFNKPRKLPLIKDILDRLYQISDAEYLVFTNLDICLMPQFYIALNDFIASGHDALVINRRRISGKYDSESQLDIMYSEIGEAHTGYDAFVFKRSLYEKFIMKSLCVGIPRAGNDLFYNIFCFAENPKLLTDKHLTFHIGMDLYKEWGDKEHEDHNRSELKALIKELSPHIDISKFPGAELNIFSRHFKWLMNPTFHYPTMMKADLGQLGRKRKQREKVKKTLKQRYLEWLIRQINFD